MDGLPALTIERPTSIAHAVALLRTPGARVLAGGTDLVPKLRRGIDRPVMLVTLEGIDGLEDVVCSDDGLVLGAAVTLDRLANDERIARGYAAIAQAAGVVGGPQHRNAATLGGNLCLDTRCVFYNQSEWWRAANGWCLKRGGDTCHVAPQGKRCHAAFSGDMAPALMALDAEVECVSPQGTRRMPISSLYREDGAAHLTLETGEFVTRVFVTRAPGAVSAYRKARIRGAIDFPLAGVALALVREGARIVRLRVALTGTNTAPLALGGTEALEGKAVDATTLQALAKLVARQVSPMRTTTTASHYRRQVAAVLARRLLGELGA